MGLGAQNGNADCSILIFHQPIAHYSKSRDGGVAEDMNFPSNGFHDSPLNMARNFNLDQQWSRRVPFGEAFDQRLLHRRIPSFLGSSRQLEAPSSFKGAGRCES